MVVHTTVPIAEEGPQLEQQLKVHILQSIRERDYACDGQRGEER